MDMWFGNHEWTSEIPSDLSQNEDFLAVKALIKKARSEPRKTVLTLRALAIKGRAKTADPVLKFLVDMPDGVAWRGGAARAGWCLVFDGDAVAKHAAAPSVALPTASTKRCFPQRRDSL